MATSWGRVLHAAHEWVDPATLVPGAQWPKQHASLLPFGNGRSYGDSNLNPGGALIEARRLAEPIVLDAVTGRLSCGAGVLLSQVLELALPQGWFLTVTPGTRFVTVGGAIANDVHGKNHHRHGSFGTHVLGFDLLRSDGTQLACSRERHSEWFAATIGGLGLTGLVVRAVLQLRSVAGPWIEHETIRFGGLDAFFELSEASRSSHEYTASWIDCTAGGGHLGRGWFERGNHAAAGPERPAAPQRALRVEFTPPFSFVGPLTTRAFNLGYYHLRRPRPPGSRGHLLPFLFPLDAVLEWNRLYGPRGFYQYQCVVPHDRAAHTIRRLLEAIRASGMGSFLAVLKQFGDAASPGLLSFPLPGTTLALDFPSRGAQLHRLFAALDALVRDAGGRLYPAKDGRMDAAMFRAGYPRWREFGPYVDPRLSSAFGRRVMPEGFTPPPG